MGYRHAWVGIGLAVADESMKGFNSMISIENCEGSVKRCLAVNIIPPNPSHGAPMSFSLSIILRFSSILFVLFSL